MMIPQKPTLILHGTHKKSHDVDESRNYEVCIIGPNDGFMVGYPCHFVSLGEPSHPGTFVTIVVAI